jgi:hypothetical protein
VLLARGRALELVDAQPVRVQGSLVLLVLIEPNKDPAHWFRPIRPGRFTRLSAVELDAAEAKMPRVHAAGTSLLQLQTLAADGTVRAGALMLSELEDDTALAGEGEVLLRRDTDAIRLVVGQRVVYETRRPAIEPQIEALLFENQPLRIGMRAHGMTAPLQLVLNDRLSGEIYSIDQLNPPANGEESCWMLVANLPELQGGNAPSFLFILQDFFHQWNFGPPAPSSSEAKP